MPLGHILVHKFRYFNSDGVFTKQDILNKLLAVDNAKAYRPDDIKYKNLTWDYPLSVSKYVIL